MLKPLLLLFTLLFTLPLSAAVSVEDDSGRTVALSVPAQRIVSLAPHITEQLFAIGAGEQIVGAVEYSDYPEQAQAIPRVGGYSRLDLERILALEPDLVVGWHSGNDPRQLERLEQLGLTVYRSEPRTLREIAASMRRLGILSDRADEAGAEAALFMQKLQRLATINRDRPARRLFYQIWNRPLMTINGEHLISDVIRLCGGENIFADLPALTPTISTEAVLAADPDIIIASGMGEARPEWLDEWHRWDLLRAVRNDQLHFIPPDLLQRATPRLLKGAEQVCRIIHDAHSWER